MHLALLTGAAAALLAALATLILLSRRHQQAPSDARPNSDATTSPSTATVQARRVAQVTNTANHYGRNTHAQRGTDLTYARQALSQIGSHTASQA
jgi:hypothetical protein